MLRKVLQVKRWSFILKTLYRSIVAGILIGIACIVSVFYDDPELIFSSGVFCIILCGGLLYTGVVGHYSIKQFKTTLFIFLGNFIGISLITLYAKFFMDYKLFESIISYKTNTSYVQWFLCSVFCGMLMCAATSLRIENSFFTTFICIAAFIIGKFEHSVADSFYLMLDGIHANDFVRIFIAIVGNAVGAKILWWTHLLKQKQLRDS